MQLINNHILIEADTHYNWILNSGGIKWLHLPTYHDEFIHSISSGTVVETCESLTKSYPYGTTIELQKGDKVIFHYLAIGRDRDGHRITHDRMINGNYAIRYNDVYARVRDNVLTPINGYVLVKPLEEEFKSKIIIPEYLKKSDYTKKRRAHLVCEISHIGTPVSYYPSPEEGIKDEDEWTIGQKVIIPAWRALELQKAEHQIIDYGTLYYRCHRKDLMDYNWVMESISEWNELHPREQNNNRELVEAIKNFRSQRVSERPSAFPQIVIPRYGTFGKKYTHGV